MSQLFKKTVENFVCQKCGVNVTGNGFTNHCPKCLWGKHVDINPGDRKGECGGMMEPVRIEKKGKVSNVIHKCVKCGIEKPNKVSPNDEYDAVLKVAENYAKKSTNSL